MGGRSYSDPNYGGRHSVYVKGTDVTVVTNASAATIGIHTFMYPCKVLDWNVTCIVPGTDYTALTSWTVGKSLAGTGSVVAFGTADMLAATATHQEHTVTDASVTETSFAAGDDVVFQLEGTGGGLGEFINHLEVQETFVVTDS